MSKTDIYKSREQAQMTSDDPRFRKVSRRRRSSSKRTFDVHERRRRKKNSGFRRLLHLFRKPDNEKNFWWGLLILFVVLLSLIALWQFWYVEYAARKNSDRNAIYEPSSHIHTATSAAE
ncbi:MAG: hypothetical protein K9M54_00825 [Kiritimatiellales bacterium]|nr:hypothetical protein [Kiritimatiellales bacterium]MCF7863245.1 hypothetical protein [Kiritimatiellales bacterium]